MSNAGGLKVTAQGDREIVMTRVFDAPRTLVFDAWTKPELFARWFGARGWTVPVCEIDLRPGGIFRTVMRSPEGQEFDNAGCVLEVIENRRFAWTGALKPGYRPRPNEEASKAPFLFSAVITMEPEGKGTRYRALAIHADHAGAETHEKMGFHTGWGAALDQLVEYMSSR